VLAGHAEHDRSRVGGGDDLARGVEIGGDGLLQLDVFVVAGRGLDGLQAEVGKVQTSTKSTSARLHRSSYEGTNSQPQSAANFSPASREISLQAVTR